MRWCWKGPSEFYLGYYHEEEDNWFRPLERHQTPKGSWLTGILYLHVVNIRYMYVWTCLWSVMIRLAGILHGLGQRSFILPTTWKVGYKNQLINSSSFSSSFMEVEWHLSIPSWHLSILRVTLTHSEWIVFSLIGFCFKVAITSPLSHLSVACNLKYTYYGYTFHASD